ncbi:hypothetical protein [Novosphingobium sp. KN65.2]|uniref:Kelch repeat-containing protein n=1 Tax=Novosphingobium sp. KN65.2 TaxID=1478134 RepID=UPI0018CFF92F|nr:hypothetical protein [Novosphingobium sp. KN65.2]
MAKMSAAMALCGSLSLFLVVDAARAADEPALWKSLPPLPVSVAEVAVAAEERRIHVVGGTEVSPQGIIQNASSTHHIYDGRSATWSAGAPFPVPTSHLAMTVMNGRLYALGGFDDIVHIGPQRGFYVYDPTTDRWKALPPLTVPRGSIALVAVAGKLHALGGRLSDRIVDVPTPDGMLKVGEHSSNMHEVFDPKTGAWTTAAALPGPPRDHMGIGVIEGRIHVFGGRINDFSGLLDRHDVYDPRVDKWTSAAPLPEARSAGAFAVAGGRIIYAGGECKPGGGPGMVMTFADVTAYDPRYDRWVDLPAMPAGRHALGAAVVGRDLYLVGGSPICGGGASPDFVRIALP